MTLKLPTGTSHGGQRRSVQRLYPNRKLLIKRELQFRHELGDKILLFKGFIRPAQRGKRFPKASSRLALLAEKSPVSAFLLSIAPTLCPTLDTEDKVKPVSTRSYLLL